MKWLIAGCLSLVFCACVRSTATTNDSIYAYVPVYASKDDRTDIHLEEARPIDRPGKIYAYRHYIFQNEQYKGIHVIDNSDPAHPVKTAFLAVPYNTEMAIRGNYIYANSVDDLVVIDISDPLQPSEVSRTKNAFPLISQTYPPEHGYFVCPDPEKGVVIDWKLENVPQAKCRR